MVGERVEELLLLRSVSLSPSLRSFVFRRRMGLDNETGVQFAGRFCVRAGDFVGPVLRKVTWLRALRSERFRENQKKKNSVNVVDFRVRATRKLKTATNRPFEHLTRYDAILVS